MRVEGGLSGKGRGSVEFEEDKKGMRVIMVTVHCIHVQRDVIMRPRVTYD